MVRVTRRQLWSAYCAGTGRRADAAPDQAIVELMRRRVPYAGILLGVDPSLRGTGLVVVEFAPVLRAPKLLYHTTVRCPPSLGFVSCLGYLLEEVERVMQVYKVSEAALEETIYVQNRQIAQKMGAARGAIIAPLARSGIPVEEYAPLRIKQAVVGTGRASKEQVARTVGQLMGLARALPSDESDALAVALCHAWTVGGGGRV